ncbi:hypothetical protein X772_08330 [Mesorhizobium sp. LSJC280B00]|nr:hypothetical protein X772_08330 [Mesorhizobium sp. LSJC280B00]
MVVWNDGKQAADVMFARLAAAVNAAELLAR